MARRVSRKVFLGSVGAFAGLVATSSPFGSSANSNPIIIENAKPGSTGWQLTNPATLRQIEGYANRTSVAPGQTISFFMNTQSASYTVEIYRLGWYGGAGGRLHLTSGSRKRVNQTIPTPNSTTGLCQCNWTSPWTITIPAGTNAWVSGHYLAKLTTREGKQAHIPFIVRDDNRYATYMVQASVTTWQAYNNWGGKSLYDYNSTNGKRAYKVSFNRPYAGTGSGDLYNPDTGWELNILRFFEREGYDVKYITNIDLHENVNRLYNCHSFISAGHDEYWSMQMRSEVEYVTSEGIHVAFLGANDAYWQIRFESGSTNGANRTMVCYKDAALDPNGNSTDPNVRQYTTIKFRDLNRPEATMIGVQYVHYPVNTDMIVKNTNHFLFAGTGLKNGDRLVGMVGYEADQLSPFSPPNVIVLAETPVVTDYSNGFHHMTFFTRQPSEWGPGGGTVFATGSMQWAWGLDSFFGGISHPNLQNPEVQIIMRNVMNSFAI